MLKAERLTLREVEQSDFRDIHEYSSDFETTYFLGWGPNVDEEMTQNFMNNWFDNNIKTPRRDYHFAACKEDGTFIGVVWVNIGGNLKDGSVGWIVNKKFWRNGYASEAAAALLVFCFAELKLHRVYAKCDTENTASYKVMEKLGMRREAHFRESYLLHNEWRDEFYYTIIDKEWIEKARNVN